MDSCTKYILTIFFIMLFFSFSYAKLEESEAETDTAIASKLGWMAYPYAFYAPEIQLAIGGAASRCNTVFCDRRTTFLNGPRITRILRNFYSKLIILY
jgi:hypothetical protein